MLREGSKKIGMNEHRNNFRNCINCMQCGFCHLGCHYDTKQNVLVTYIHQALTNTNNSHLKIYCNCYVDKIDYDSDEGNEIVKRVEGNFVDIDGNNKFKIKINAKITIISAGAIASSEILGNTFSLIPLSHLLIGSIFLCLSTNSFAKTYSY